MKASAMTVNRKRSVRPCFPSFPQSARNRSQKSVLPGVSRRRVLALRPGPDAHSGAAWLEPGEGRLFLPTSDSGKGRTDIACEGREIG